MPAEAEVLRRPGLIELNLISENVLNDYAKKQMAESSASLSGAM